jgi:hypothetical protein
MNELLKKLNFKEGSEVFIKNFPADLQLFKNDLFASSKAVFEDLNASENISFTLVFATKQNEIDTIALQIAERVKGDAMVWFVYPKGTSKRYKCEFNRDTGWTEMGKCGFETVRMVAIDADWSALRFRREIFVKKMTRNEAIAISEKGKERVSK